MKFLKGRKVIASILLATMFLSGSIIPQTVFAERGNDNVVDDLKKEELKVLTLEDAIKKAITNSVDLKIVENEKEKADELANQAGNAYNKLNYVKAVTNGNGVKDEQQKQVTMAVEQTSILQQGSKIKENATLDFLKFGVTASFYNINKISKDIDFADAKASNLQKTENITRMKQEVGYESDLSLKNSKIDTEKAIKDKKKSQEDLNAEYIKLNKLIGYNKEKREILQDELVYVPLKDSEEDVNYRVQKGIEIDPTVWQKQKEAEIADMNVNLYVYNVQEYYTSQNRTLMPYRVEELNSAIAYNQIDQQKQNIETIVRTTYNNIKKLEAVYDSLQTDKEKLDQNYKALKAKYDAGMATKQELSDLELKKKELEAGIYGVVVQHELLKMVYEKPFLYSAISK